MKTRTRTTWLGFLTILVLLCFFGANIANTLQAQTTQSLEDPFLTKKTKPTPTQAKDTDNKNAKSSVTLETKSSSKTSPIQSKTANTDIEEDFIDKFEFYATLERRLPNGWEISHREPNIVVYKPEVTIVEKPLEVDPADLELGESIEEKKRTMLADIPKKSYEILLKLEAYPKAAYLDAKKRNARAYEEIEALKVKHQLGAMMKDAETGDPVAMSKAEKNHLASYWVDKEQLQKDLKAVPRFYVDGYTVAITRNTTYHKIYPDSTEKQAISIVSQVEQLLSDESAK